MEMVYQVSSQYVRVNICKVTLFMSNQIFFIFRDINLMLTLIVIAFGVLILPSLYLVTPPFIGPW